MKRSHLHGQHFLRSPKLVAELIGHSNIRKNDTVVDLGAGSGIISSVLARRAKQVIAVEIEPQAVSKLRDNMREHENVSIVVGDALQINLPTDGYKVFSNIPFHISAQIIRRLTTSDNPPKSIYLIVQKQFALKLVPSDRHFTSQLGSEIAPWWQARIRRPLRKTDFTPPPAVESVLLELKPRQDYLLEKADQKAYGAFVEQCYSRQDIFASRPRAKAGIDSEKKPSELTPEQWAKLYTLTKKS